MLSDHELNVQIGQALRDERKRRRYTLEYIGQSLGVHKSTVYLWETGRNGISAAQLKKILRRLHDLRHSHATLLINSGVNIVAVSKRLGHSSINQTLKTYTHLLKNTDDELINTLEKLEENK